MANEDFTAELWDEAKLGLEVQPVDGPTLCPTRFWRKVNPNLEHKFRRMAPRLKATFSGMELAKVDAEAPQFFPNSKHYIYKPTTPQFSGTVLPTKNRQAYLCKLVGTESRTRQVLERIWIEADGTFESKGWYPVDPQTSYVLFVEGDDTHESVDFLLRNPAEHQFFWGKDNQGNSIAAGNNYDTATGHRTLLVHEDFEGAQAASLNVKTPVVDSVGTGWTVSAGGVLTGQHLATGNFVGYSAAGTPQYAVIDTGNSDVYMKGEVILGQASLNDAPHGFVLRFTNVDNYLYAVIEDGSTANPYLRLYQRVAGVNTLVREACLYGARTRAVNTFYEMQVLAYQDTIWYQINLGDRVWSDHVKHYSIQQSAGWHGIYVGGSGMYHDNFKVWTV
jgi:hypothetical protein